MGNILVSETFFGQNLWSFNGGVVATCWLILLIYVIFKTIIEKPWTSNAVNSRAIAETQEKRSKRFIEVKKRVDGQNEELRNEILSLSFFQLKDSLQSGKYNAQKVLFAYAWKALEVQEKLNCLCEFLIESFDEAEALDKKYEDSDNKPPLYGIPFSVKGNFYVKGYDCCIGLAQLLNDPKDKDCSFVTQLRNLGAIPFVTTNVPQTLLSFICSNPVYGVTGNPHITNRTPGGSSGGEACLLAAGGTPFATGSDIAGSLRIPANFCGVYTIKPTQDRFVVENTTGCVPGRGRLGLSYGFFTKSVEEQNFLLSLVLGSEDYKLLITRNAASLPFNEKIYEKTVQNKKIRIGYFIDDGFTKHIPAVQRNIEETVEKLKTEGYELVKFNVPNPHGIASSTFRAILPDGGAFFTRLFDNDIVDIYLKQFAFLLKIPKFLRFAVSIVLSPISPQVAGAAGAYVQTAEDVRATNQEIDDYTIQFIALWKELGIDALLCPPFPIPAVPHQYGSQLSFCGFSTALFNVLDFPAGIVPTSKVTKEDDLNLADEKTWPTGVNFVLKVIRSAAANSEGLPLSVQVVTLPFEEEKCLGIMKIVDETCKKR